MRNRINQTLQTAIENIFSKNYCGIMPDSLKAQWTSAATRTIWLFLKKLAAEFPVTDNQTAIMRKFGSQLAKYFSKRKR